MRKFFSGFSCKMYRFIRLLYLGGTSGIIAGGGSMLVFWSGYWLLDHNAFGALVVGSFFGSIFGCILGMPTFAIARAITGTRIPLMLLFRSSIIVGAITCIVVVLISIVFSENYGNRISGGGTAGNIFFAPLAMILNAVRLRLILPEAG